MKDASVTDNSSMRTTPFREEVEYCGACKFFMYEDADGFGYCRKFDTIDVRCSDVSCKLFEEDLR